MDYEFILGILWFKNMNLYINQVIKEIINRENLDSRYYKNYRENILLLNIKSIHKYSLLNTQTEASKEVPKEYVIFADIFKKENIKALPFLRDNLDYYIELILNAKP